MTPRARSRVALALVVVAASGGCIVTPLGHTSDVPILVAGGQHEIIDELVVPEVRGLAGCGAQALSAAIGHLTGRDPGSLADELPWQDQGATPIDLVLAARRQGCTATLSAGSWEDLALLVRSRTVSLVMLDAGPEVRTLLSVYPTAPVMHWAVVTGMARDDSEVLLGLPHHRVAIVPRAWFMDRWSRSEHCLIVIESPGA